MARKFSRALVVQQSERSNAWFAALTECSSTTVVNSQCCNANMLLKSFVFEGEMAATLRKVLVEMFGTDRVQSLNRSDGLKKVGRQVFDYCKRSVPFQSMADGIGK